jgi:hypothetical protein
LIIKHHRVIVSKFAVSSSTIICCLGLWKSNGITRNIKNRIEFNPHNEK